MSTVLSSPKSGWPAARKIPVVLLCFAVAAGAVCDVCFADSVMILNHDSANHLIGASGAGSSVQLVHDANGNMTGVVAASVATLTAGNTQGGQVVTAGSVAFFNFTAPGGVSLALDLISASLSPASAALQVNVYDSKGGLVGSTTGPAGTVLSLPALAAGTYLVSVQAQSSATGSFQLELVSS